MQINILESIIYPSLKEIQENMARPIDFVESRETVLFGGESNLDSLSLVSLILTVEEKVEDFTGISITLADEKAMSRKNSPFKNVALLESYIEELLKENGYEQ